MSGDAGKQVGLCAHTVMCKDSCIETSKWPVRSIDKHTYIGLYDIACMQTQDGVLFPISSPDVDHGPCFDALTQDNRG